MESLVAGDYRSAVRASDPRRFPSGLVAYARLEYGEASPQWLLTEFEECGAPHRSDDRPRSRSRVIWDQIRQAVGSFLF